MYVVFDERQDQHAPKRYFFCGQLRQFPESPARTQRLLVAAREFGCRRRSPRDFGLSAISTIHSSDYLEFLSRAHEQWTAVPDASEEVFPHVHGDRYVHGRPSAVIGLAGLYMAGTNCPLGAGTWSATYASAQCAIEAAELVSKSEPAAYALCRPPGHHAYTDLAGGFCYLNNAAIAAAWMLNTFSRVAIIDIDIHHGNGTQEIFYRRNDVYFLSVHADPANLFPFYSGYACERGADSGYGLNLNVPLPPGSGDDAVTDALRRGTAELQIYDPEALVVSLGFDASLDDPIGVFRVTPDGFKQLGQILAELAIPTVLVQEGGYGLATLGTNLIAFLSGFSLQLAKSTGRRRRPPIDRSLSAVPEKDPSENL
jgi:acetoin utilization deacetylase AcuC-like enzyme